MALETYPTLPFSDNLEEYCGAITYFAADRLRDNVVEFITTSRATDGSETDDLADIGIETKVDTNGTKSLVTDFDKDTERLIGILCGRAGIRVDGEEGTAVWHGNTRPLHIADVDPIDGTALAIEYIQALLQWSRLPEDARPLRPTVGSMVSMGIRPNRENAVSRIGSFAAPFLETGGIVQWMAGPNTPSVRIEPDGTSYELPFARDIAAPKTDGVVLVASKSAETALSMPLREQGIRVIRYESAVAIAACVMDPGLFERLQPGVLDGGTVVGAALRTAKRWDRAATEALARLNGFFLRDAQGNHFTSESTGAAFAIRPAIGRTILEAMAFAG